MAAALVAVAAWPVGAALAQTARYAPAPTVSPETAGYYLIPSATLAEVFDSNVFLNTNPEFDFISRLTLGGQLGYRSAPFTILGNYSFDTEVYARNPSLDNVGQNQRGSLDVRYLPERHTTLGLNAAFARTNNPVLLSQQVGLQPVAQIQPGRQESTGFTITPSVSHQFSQLWSGNASYAYSIFTGQNTSSTTSNVLTLGTTRLFSPADTGALNYYFRTYDSSQGLVTSNVFTLGWTHRFSEFTTVSARAGPRFSQGQVRPEVFASVQHRMKFVDLSLTYAVDAGCRPGRVGARDHQLRVRDAQASSWRASSGLGGAELSDLVERGALEHRARPTTTPSTRPPPYQINKWLSAGASYSWSLQTGSGGDIPHNLLAVGLTVAYPLRID